MRKQLLLSLLGLASLSGAEAQIKLNRKVVDTLPIRQVDPTIRPAGGTKIISNLNQPQRDIDFPNWNFEKGLTGWTKEGTAFNNQPTVRFAVTTQRINYQMEYNQGGVGGDYWKNMGMNNGHNGNYWVGTYENNPQGNSFNQYQGDQPVGILTSPEFLLTNQYCYFLIGGGADPQRLYVEFQTKQADGSWKTEITRSSFRNSEMMYRERLDLAAFVNKVGRIRIVDNSYAGWGHINVDNIRFSNTLLDGIQIRDAATGRNYEVDVDAPVWGVADTHAHPMHQEGFGGALIAGKPNTPLSETYSNALCDQKHSSLGAGVSNKLFILGADPHFTKGWPDFLEFPRFNSKTHQQQHVDFLKRAWQGGLRIYCALAINNMYVPSLALGPGTDGRPYDDESAIKRQIIAITEMVNQNYQWMGIAKSPREARKLILEGKLAVVLGIETDNLGNFKTASYNWNDNVGPANKPLVALNDVNADQFLENKLNEYYIDGVRQITPIHYITGVFGGAAVFRGELAANQFTFNNNVSVRSGLSNRIPYSLFSDYTTLLFASNPLLTKAGYEQRILKQGGGTELSTINAARMTSIGVKLINKMMTKGFIIDSEHMGYDTKDDLFSLAATRNYPVISSHTDPAGLSYSWLGQPVAFRENTFKPDQIFNQNNFGTTNIRNLANEFEMSDAHYGKITNSGGTVGVFMLPYLKKAYTGTLGNIPNDCAGSTKTWAQMYLYSVDKMNYRGVALCTDRGMTDFIGPRFGPNSAFTLKDEKLMDMKIAERKRQRLAQSNGVRYDVNMRSYYPVWYENMETGGTEIIVSYQEEDAWKALAANEAGLNKDNVPGGREFTRELRVKYFLEGLQVSAMDDPAIKNMHYMEKAAMFCVKNNRSVTSLPGYAGWFQGDKDNVIAIHNEIIKVWQVWQTKYGNNQPLRRFRTGNRDWDFNTDGMAHYGLMPDFFQDLSNIGLNNGKLWFLFNSAEDYIAMWEKTVKASGTR